MASARSWKIASVTGVSLDEEAGTCTATDYDGNVTVVDGDITAGTLVALAALVTRVYQPLPGLTNARVDLMTSMVSFERVFEVIDLPLDIAERPDAVTLRDTHGYRYYVVATGIEGKENFEVAHGVRNLDTGDDFFVADGSVDEDVFAYSNRLGGAGEARALVVYHNRYADTGGWIHLSCPVSVQDAKGRNMLQRSLGQGLGLLLELGVVGVNLGQRPGGQPPVDQADVT